MLYLSFPVTMFWISNQAEYFEEYIVKRKVSVNSYSSLSYLCLIQSVNGDSTITGENC